jgi:signal transduction histidine kinase
MDAVAAAIADEVGQPLAATKLSASAGLSWLDRAKPDRTKAIKSLHETIDAGDRTFEVIKSLRAMFTFGSLSEFDLNDLVRETALLLERDLTAHKVSLELSLGDVALPMRANQIKIQRVLFILLTNAIESVSATPRRARRVAIRSTLEEEKVLLDISDTGLGIPPEKIEQIFDPFFSISATGTGLGLSLARTIIEEHGGRLWVSSDKDHGTTFHLQMNYRREAEKLYSSSGISEEAQAAARPPTLVELHAFGDEAAHLLSLICSELAALRAAECDQAWLRRLTATVADMERKLSSLV